MRGLLWSRAEPKAFQVKYLKTLNLLSLYSGLSLLGLAIYTQVRLYQEFKAMVASSGGDVSPVIAGGNFAFLLLPYLAVGILCTIIISKGYKKAYAALFILLMGLIIQFVPVWIFFL